MGSVVYINTFLKVHSRNLVSELHNTPKCQCVHAFTPFPYPHITACKHKYTNQIHALRSIVFLFTVLVAVWLVCVCAQETAAINQNEQTKLAFAETSLRHTEHAFE
jgi:hypothetical protein